MEVTPIVQSIQDQKATHYTDVLAKRIRPKISADDLEMKNRTEEKKKEESEVRRSDHPKKYLEKPELLTTLCRF